MAYNTQLAERVRKYLSKFAGLSIDEKQMFRGLTFMVNGKMCVSISGENLMCRFDPVLQGTVEGLKGFEIMNMKGRVYKGYCYVRPEGCATQKDLAYWVDLCLDFNPRAKASKK